MATTLLYARPRVLLRASPIPARPSTLRLHPLRLPKPQTALRHNSTIVPPTTTTPSAPLLTWSEYLAIRRSKRRWELATTIPATFVGLGGGAAYFGSLEADAANPIFGIEPMWVYAAATIACMGFGYLVGPMLGSSMWRLTHRRILPLIDARDKEFHHRITKKRVDPSRQSAMNPVPDYYGEKIGSLHDYRRWLRDQAKYNKKAMWPEN